MKGVMLMCYDMIMGSKPHKRVKLKVDKVRGLVRTSMTRQTVWGGRLVRVGAETQSWRVSKMLNEQIVEKWQFLTKISKIEQILEFLQFPARIFPIISGKFQYLGKLRFVNWCCNSVILINDYLISMKIRKISGIKKAFGFFLEI